MLQFLPIFVMTVAGPSAAAVEFTFAPAARYAPEVPPPDALLGYRPGERFSTHDRIVRAVHAIDDASDRVRVIEYGETFETRPLLLAVVSTPSNLARLEPILDGVGRLADPRRIASDEERARLLDDLPVIVWLSFTVHGNEPSGTEASLPLLYHLAAAEDDAVEALRKNAIVLLDPCLNPDGRDRYVHWYDSVRGRTPNPDPQAAEHHEPWPGGRVNHFYFDLNRDWAFVTQRESRARLRAFRRFHPQVHADLHEMMPNSSYFFFPAAPPVNQNVPASTLRLGEAFGRGNAAAFDRYGWRYFTGESFDLLYPGYGDSWPSLNGAIGMTYEQGGHSVAGLAIRRGDGTVLTLEDRVQHHFTAALATVETAVRTRRDLLEHFLRFHEDGLWEGQEGGLAEVLLIPGTHHGRAEDLVSLLLAQGIEVHRVEADFEAVRCHPFGDNDASETRRFPAGTFLVSMAQPKKRLAKALLEPRAAVLENRFYDISAWSLPLAFGVEAYWTERRSEVAAGPIQEVEAPAGEVVGESGRVGYLVHWDALDAARFADRLLRGGTRVEMATESFAIDGEAYAPGTLFVPSVGNGGGVRDRVAAAAAATRVTARAIDTGWTSSGPDLGSDAWSGLATPSIAVVSGEGTSASGVGAVKFLLEEQLGVPYSAVSIERWSGLDLRRYNVLIVPDGFGYGSRIGKSDGLKAWIEEGGVAIGLAGGAFYLGGEAAGLTRVKTGGADEESKADKTWKTIREMEADRRERNVPGTLFQVRLDPDHPLAFSYPRTVAVLMESTRAFDVEGPGRRLGLFEDEAYLSGYISDENRKKLVGQAYLAEVSVGRGRVILFAEDPTFRGFVRGQTGLLVNAIYAYARPLGG